jgi:hypothetical protein
VCAQKLVCHLRIIRGNNVSGLVRKRRVGKRHTRNVSILCAKRRQGLAIGQGSNVTYGTFAQASSADWSAKEGSAIEGCEKLLTRNIRFIGTKYR